MLLTRVFQYSLTKQIADHRCQFLQKSPTQKKSRGDVHSFLLKALSPGNSGLNYIQKTSPSSGFPLKYRLGCWEEWRLGLLSQVLALSRLLCFGRLQPQSLDLSSLSPWTFPNHSDSLQCHLSSFKYHLLYTEDPQIPSPARPPLNSRLAGNHLDLPL